MSSRPGGASLLNFVNAYLCALIRAVRDGEVKTTQLRHKIRRVRARSRWNLGGDFLMVAIALVNDGDEAFFAGDVNPLMRGAIKSVVSVPCWRRSVSCRADRARP